jgi:hypothetical protein
MTETREIQGVVVGTVSGNVALMKFADGREARVAVNPSLARDLYMILPGDRFAIAMREPPELPRAHTLISRASNQEPPER